MSTHAQPIDADPTGAAGASSDAAPALVRVEGVGTGSWRDYVALVKPGILRLLLILTFCSMLVAQRGMPDVLLVVWTLLGMGMMSGSANAINMVYDRDIDAVMLRTQKRPLPSGKMAARYALGFAVGLGVAAFALLALLVNPLTAVVALGGHLFYVFIYTMWLKRSTPQNIVIGGAAGAVPPLVGWAAVHGELSVAAWIMFTIVFLWTPPHFWALSLYKRGDYARAGVPMLPVVRGARHTKLQMVWYTLLLVPVTVLLALGGALGWLYGLAATVLGAIFLGLSVKVLLSRGDYWPKRMFAYSILYLALLFGAMSADSLLVERAPEGPVLELVPVSPSGGAGQGGAQR